jgi:regulatory protein
MKITKLEYQKNNQNRVNVYVDGNFAVGISQNDVLTLGLYKDKEISQQELSNIVAQSEFGKMLNFAINFLSFRPRSEWEMRFHLRKKTKDEELINRIIEKLTLIKQIDDESFAKWFLDQRNTFRPKSDRILTQELRAKGIGQEIIKKVLSEDETSELEKALKLIKKPMDREKVIRYLGSRGFSWDIIKDVLAKLKNKE